MGALRAVIVIFQIRSMNVTPSYRNCGNDARSFASVNVVEATFGSTENTIANDRDLGLETARAECHVCGQSCTRAFRRLKPKTGAIRLDFDRRSQFGRDRSRSMEVRECARSTRKIGSRRLRERSTCDLHPRRSHRRECAVLEAIAAGRFPSVQ